MHTGAIFGLLLLAGLLIVALAQVYEHHFVARYRLRRMSKSTVHPVGNSTIDRIEAPWTDDQVKSLNGYQEDGCVHPFTGPNGGILVATRAGWVEPLVDAPDLENPATYAAHAINPKIVQKWAHRFMADWTWKRVFAPAKMVPPPRVWCETCDDRGFIMVNAHGPQEMPCECAAGQRLKFAQETAAQKKAAPGYEFETGVIGVRDPVLTERQDPNGIYSEPLTVCVDCDKPIVGGTMIGSGRGDGNRFAHAECYRNRPRI